MPSETDDDALSWGDEVDDSTHVHGVAAAPVDGATSDSVAPAASVSPSAGSSVLLVVYGVFGGVYLLFVIGWVIGVQRDTYTAPDLVSEIMYQFGEFLAIASPVLWFVTTLVLTRDRRAITRFLWLLAGVLMLAPWPFIVSGSVA